jgi:heptosyltransferase-1
VDDPQRIALVRLSHLGDVVLALPLFHALRERFGAARIAWVVQSEFAGLLDGLPGLERVVRFERRGGARAWLALKQELGGFGAQLAVDAQGNWKSALATLATGATRRIGLAPRDWRERGAWAAMTEFAEPLEAAREHSMERTRALCERVSGRRFAPEELRRDAALTADELAAGRAQLGQLAPRAADPFVVVQLSSPDDVRAWPLANAVELARQLTRAGRAVLLLSGPAEADEGRRAADELAGEPGVLHWIGQRGLRALASFFHAAAERGASYVGGDTGPTHLAAACGLPVTLLAGPQTHLRTGPWPVAEPSPHGPSPHRVLRSALEVDCAPCFARACRHPQGPVCMASIEPAAVTRALLRT